MIEIYNDKLVDLLRPNNGTQVAETLKSYLNFPFNYLFVIFSFLWQEKLEIKKDKQGIVWVQGSRVCPVSNAAELNNLFRSGLDWRHTASTRMNDQSSRSHLIVGITVESVNRLHGTVIRGKVST